MKNVSFILQKKKMNFLANPILTSHSLGCQSQDQSLALFLFTHSLFSFTVVLFFLNQ